MQAVILAGGKGTRLRPLTYRMPKSMVPIHDKPFLQHQLELIKSFGIKEVLLLVSYLGEQIAVYDNSKKIALNNITIGKSNLIIDYNKKDSKGMT